MSDALTTKFNLIETPAPVKNNLPDPLNSDVENAIEDFTAVRKNMISVLEVGEQAVKELADIASSRQDAETYTSLAQMIKAMTDGTSKVLQLHKQIDELKHRPGSAPTTETHNHLHVMSTFDLAQQLKEIKGE